MIISKFLIGIPIIIIGFVLIVIPFIFFQKSLFIFWIYGIPMIVIGIVLVLNKKEDVIEQINYKKMKGGKK